MINDRSRVDLISSLMCGVVLLMVMLLLCGCTRPSAAAAVDPDLARSVLRDVLESWQQGGSLEQWKSAASPVVIQDADWQSGLKLLEFELVNPGQPLDANLHCPVLLVLQDGTARRLEKQVTYIVGTDPVVTVFRDPFNSQ